MELRERTSNPVEPMRGRPPDSIELVAVEERPVGGREDREVDWGAIALLRTYVVK